MRNLIIIGGGSHAKVIADIAASLDFNILGVLDDNADTTHFPDYDVLGKVEDCVKFADKAQFIIAIGNNAVRKQIAEKYNLDFATLVHPRAFISPKAKIGKGTVVMPMAVVNTNASVGEHCIINSAAVVEHASRVGNFVLVSPQVSLCGTVTVGDNCHIGAGASVINNKSICADCIIGAGATVIRDLVESGTYVGVPARVIK